MAAPSPWAVRRRRPRAAPVSGDYASEVLRDHPIAYWRLGELSGPTAADASPMANHGTYSAAGVAYRSPGALPYDHDTAVTLDGLQGRVTVTPVMQLAPGQPFTIEAWVKPSGGGYRGVFQAHQGVDNLGVWIEGNRSLWCRVSSASAFPFAGTAAESVPNDVWSHVAVTYDGATVRYYINGGARQTTLNAPGSAATSGVWSLGSWGAGNWFPGGLDEVAVYPAALSADRLLAHYRTATTQPPEPEPEPVPITPDYTLYWGSYNGWNFGEGTPWAIEQVDGLADMMDLDTQDANVPGDGGVFGADWEHKRVITVDFATPYTPSNGNGCFASAPGGVPIQGLDVARCACLRRQDDIPLQVNDQWVIMARPRKFVAPQRRAEPVKVTVSWEAADPALYESIERSATVWLRQSGVGRVYPRTFPWDYVGESSTGGVTITNYGCRRTFLRARIWGPVKEPVIHNDMTGERLALLLTLTSTDVVDIDMRRGTIVLNGSERVYWAITEDSTWFALGPGETSISYYTESGVTSLSQIAYWWRSAW